METFKSYGPWFSRRKVPKGPGKRNEYHRHYYQLNRDRIREYKRNYSREWRRKYGYHNEMLSKARYPEKEKARYELRKAIDRGAIKKLPCHFCGSQNSEAHHPDYSKPLEVIWVCRQHHTELHDRDKNDGSPKMSLQEYQDNWVKNMKRRERERNRLRLINEKRLADRKKELELIVERNELIKTLRPTMTLQELADKFGITRERIRQIVPDYKQPRKIYEVFHKDCSVCKRNFDTIRESQKFCSNECRLRPRFAAGTCHKCGKKIDGKSPIHCKKCHTIRQMEYMFRTGRIKSHRTLSTREAI